MVALHIVLKGGHALGVIGDFTMPGFQRTLELPNMDKMGFISIIGNDGKGTDVEVKFIASEVVAYMITPLKPQQQQSQIAKPVLMPPGRIIR